MKFETSGNVDIYPVGLLRELQQFIHAPDRRKARQALRCHLRYPLRQARAHDWRAVKSYFNGYLAEPQAWPEGLTRCGSGWTRSRAYRDLQRRHARQVPGGCSDCPEPSRCSKDGCHAIEHAPEPPRQNQP